MNNSIAEKCDFDIRFLQDTLYVLSGKWKLPIIAAIFNGANRYSDILRAIPDITSRMLSKELKELEMNKLVERSVKDSIPVYITYQLTPYSSSLEGLVIDMITWGKQHRKIISLNLKQPKQE
ncbi:helix-turn-helix domain-containing protein (plasmid) [Spirosoma sp. SC4-14]|uniref:winged helix-turn-helix transcriptional regulator n=1 Tax=Spirosoma sp. SC4-14 TaxID=3128900 RepID=UPI0030D0158A